MSQATMTALPLAPWGSPPTPLLPRWYREALSALKLPTKLRVINSKVKTIGDLDRFWTDIKTPIPKESLKQIIEFVYAHSLPPLNTVVIPAGMDHAELQKYPLKHRTINALRKASLLEGSEAISVGQLLSLKNFGHVSLIDLMCVSELALARHSTPISVPNITTNESNVETKINDYQHKEQNKLVESLRPLLAAAEEFYGIVTVGDALKLDLASLASTIRIEAPLDSLMISDITDGYRISDNICQELESMLESMSPTEHLIIENRLVATKPMSLEELGQRVGVSRERVRQIQRKLQRMIEKTIGTEMDKIADLSVKKMGPIISETEFNHLVTSIFDKHDFNQRVFGIARHRLRNRLEYSCINGICYNKSALTIIENLKTSALQLVDDVGLIDETALLDHLSDSKWSVHLPDLINCCGFRKFSGRLALQDKAKPKIKAALLEIGQPATKEEIASVAGLDPAKVGGHLSAIPSIARADKTRWGIVEWIDDIYEGIPAEIIQRIEEDGGATTFERLVEELPRLFGVSESSVRSYIGTPQFLLQDGYVSLADYSSLTLRNFDDVIHGRTESGEPYWTFLAEDRYFDGYSLVGLPPELAREFGCTPNGNTQIHVVKPEGCRDLSVNWRLASLSGASLGYLSEPLERLGVNSGDRVRMVIRSSKTVELCRENTVTIASDYSDSAESLLERMKNRRKVV